MEIKFTDGMTFKTAGAYRLEWRSDGCYVVGQGCLIPVRDSKEGRALIAKLGGR